LPFELGKSGSIRDHIASDSTPPRVTTQPTETCAGALVGAMR
jgi:hypothetical protein